MKKTKAIVVTGPTATGKTRFAVRLALRFNGEIIAADSRQVYKGLDIGSGKDIEEYRIGDTQIKYHLIDVADPSEEYNLMQYRADFANAFKNILQDGKLPFIVGGSPLYISAIINNYELIGGPRDERLRENLAALSNEQLADMLRVMSEDSTKAIDIRNRNRLLRTIEKLSSKNVSQFEKIDANWLLIGTYLHRKVVHEKIRQRLETRLKNGMIDEVANLQKSGLSWEKLERFGLEYKWIAMYLQGKITFDEMKNILEAKIRQFAKRQDIWFRKLEREGWKIYWMNPEDLTAASELISRFLAGEELPEPAFKISEIFYPDKNF